MDTPSNFEKERQKTDKSLSNERDKTDEYLKDTYTRTEDRTNDAISEKRAQADSERSEDRLEADTARDRDRAGPPQNPLDAQRKSDVRLQRERQSADDTIEGERSQADAIIEAEQRDHRSSEKTLLSDERKGTDVDLAHERKQSDFGIQYSTTLLAQERDDHVRTKSALTTREEFLAIVSHDLRNPLGAISQAANLLRDDPLLANSGDEQRQWVEIICRSSSEMVRLINDLLEMERVAGGRLELRMAQHEVGDVIREAVETLNSTASAKSQTLLIDPENAPATVMCDRDRVMQVLSNLIGNAVKFSPKNGVITARISPAGKEVQISVSDTGPGIPEERLGSIFDRFSQLQNRDRGGLGLGLYISKMIVEAHGGRLWVESKIEEGSTFCFTLPGRARATHDENVR